MALDGLFIHHLLEEMAGDLTGARINRIHQPDKHTLTIKLNQPQRGNFVLLLTVHPQNGRFHLTEQTRENPASPPLFAMVLRKHLEGGRILAVSQHGFDRVVDFALEGRNEIGEWERKWLIVEIMGKHSNLILTDQDKTILAAIKPYGASVSRHRQVLPNQPYLLPPQQSKLNPLLMSEASFTEALLATDLSQTLTKALFATVEGLSPQTATEIVVRSGLETTYPLDEVGLREIQRVYQVIGDLVEGDCQPAITGQDFYFLPLQSRSGKSEHFDNLNTLLDVYYDRQERYTAFASRRQTLFKQIDQQRERLAKKIAKQEAELAQANDGETYRLWGELLSANLYRVPANVTEVLLENFYDNNCPVTIPLRPELSPAGNAGRYFKRFSKAKGAKQAIENQLTTNSEELRYLDTLSDSIARCEDERTLKEIQREAAQSGYIKASHGRKQSKEREGAPLPPYQMEIDGFTVLIGRNNKQNDMLTLRTAAKDDLWLHTKDIPGSHVIIRRDNRQAVPDDVIAQAAQLAAYYSQARDADKVPVDYTEVRHVKKPKGARPGMVIYFEQTTIYVKPTCLQENHNAD